MKKIILTLFITAACLSVSTAQNTYELTLEESIEIAKNQSYSMKALEQDLIITQNNMEAAIRRLRTNISLNATAPNYSEAVREWEDSDGKITYYSARQLRMGADLIINQPLPTDGNISLETGISGIDDYNNKMRGAQMNALIRLRQPLDAFWGYNAIRADLKTARLDYERSMKMYRREELDLIYNVSQRYYMLLQRQRDMEIAKMDMERQSEVSAIAKQKFTAGLIREVESLQMEVDLANAQNGYDNSLINLNDAENSFKLLLGLDLKDRVSVKTGELAYESIIVDPEKAVEHAIANRLEMRESDISIEIQRFRIRQQKAQGRPSVDLNASYGITGVSNENIGVSYPNSFNNAWANVQERPANFAIGVSVNVPILDWGRNKRLVRAAEARQAQNILAKDNQERTIETEVRSLVSQLQSNLSRLKTLEQTVKIAEQSFNITLGRFSNDDITSDGLAEERRRLNQAYSNHLAAYVQYQLGLADLARKTFYDFQADKPIE